jgi:hypothetical protein
MVSTGTALFVMSSSARLSSNPPLINPESGIRIGGKMGLEGAGLDFMLYMADLGTGGDELMSAGLASSVKGDGATESIGERASWFIEGLRSE